MLIKTGSTADGGIVYKVYEDSVVMEDTPSNRKASLTNRIEEVMALIANQVIPTGNPQNLTWVSVDSERQVDQVTANWTKTYGQSWKVSGPCWLRLTEEEFAQIVG